MTKSESYFWLQSCSSFGLGMMLGVAVGLCLDSAIGKLRKNKKAEDQNNDDEKQ